jgi:hypothetical protein
MITLFNITGAMIYVDPYGQQTGYGVFTKIEMCRKHYTSGLGGILSTSSYASVNIHQRDIRQKDISYCSKRTFP